MPSTTAASLDVEDLLGDGPWTMARLLDDVPGNLDRLRDGLERARSGSPAGHRLADRCACSRPSGPARSSPSAGTTASMPPRRRRRFPTAPLLFAKFPSALVGDGATDHLVGRADGAGRLRGRARRRDRASRAQRRRRAGARPRARLQLPQRRVRARPAGRATGSGRGRRASTPSARWARGSSPPTRSRTRARCACAAG